MAGLAALSSLGCNAAQSYACTDASMCIVGQLAGSCQATGYCSFPDQTCESGQRYGEYAGAGLSNDCVPQGSGETDTNAATSTTGTTSTTTTSTTITTSGLTNQTTSGPLTASGDESSSTSFGTFGTFSGTASSGSETGTGSSSGGPDIPAPPCADFNFGDSNGAGATVPSVSMFDDQFTASCYPGDHADVVFFWVAPESATYQFTASVDLEDSLDVAGTLRNTCDGPELTCDDDGGGGLDSSFTFSVVEGEEYLYVVSVNGNLDAGFQMSISQQ